MMILTDTDVLNLVTSASADIEVHVSYLVSNAGVVTPARNNIASITSATTTAIVSTGTAPEIRNVKHINITNNHASVACDVTVQISTTHTLVFAHLMPGENLVFTGRGKWIHYDANGGIIPFTGGFASQALMEAAASLVAAVTPGRQHFHPGHPKAWLKGDAAGTLLSSYNVTSLGDTDTGRATVTIANDFSSANWCCLISVTRTVTTLATANTRMCNVESASQAAGTVIMECYTLAAALADPTHYHLLGLGDL
jgi:hypothetical protein